MTGLRIRYWRVVDADGVSFVTTTGRSRPKRAKGYPWPVLVDRLPGSFEDFVRGRWVKNMARAIDADHLAKHGPDAIARAHAIKAVEAGLMLAGAKVDGMIAAEARALGADPVALAQAVADKTAALIEAEVARRVAKANNRSEDAG